MMDRILSFQKFIEDLGGLHDAKVQQVVLDTENQSFSLKIDDIFSNFTDSPVEYKPKPGTITLKNISKFVIEFSSGIDEFNIDEFTTICNDSQVAKASILFWPEGKIIIEYRDVEFPNVSDY